jgi:predicted nucleic acid-binding protein
MTAEDSEPRYLVDASALLPIFVPNAASGRIKDFLRLAPRIVIVSDIAACEFAAVVSRYLRMREVSPAEGSRVLATFDAWRPANTIGVVTEPPDIRVADSFVRRFDLKLRLPDALYIATARRLGAALLTFDAMQAEAAVALGLALASV